MGAAACRLQTFLYQGLCALGFRALVAFMKNEPLLLIAVLFLALGCFPSRSHAQSANVKVPNKNQSAKYKSAIFKGSGNLIQSNSYASTIGGGQSNKVSLAVTNAVIGGGFGNAVAAAFSTVSGGIQNSNSGISATISGGYLNQVGAEGAFVGGGAANAADGLRAVVAGGYDNIASGPHSVVPGGFGNEAEAAYSLAAGKHAVAQHSNSFVWGSYPGPAIRFTTSAASESFTVRAPGGVRFITTLATNNITATNAAGTNGVALVPNGTAWATLSDSNAKTAVKAVNAREVLTRLSRLPVTEWEYRHDPNRRYFGPMAQDFHAAFGLGNDDRTINTLDADGVLFLSVKGLVEELRERDKAIDELKMKSAAFESELRTIREQLSKLPPGN
jgi:hypothetical protein